MSKLRKAVPQFPPTINRVNFGHWLSGFSAGEGCFDLFYANGTSPGCRFSIRLRRDDEPALELIRSFFNAGAISRQKPTLSSPNPMVIYQIKAVRDLKEVVVPHFDLSPLHAKKDADFQIWREAVFLVHRVSLRGRHYKSIGRGLASNWLTAEKNQFRELFDRIKAQRKYLCRPVLVGQKQTMPPELTLFS